MLPKQSTVIARPVYIFSKQYHHTSLPFIYSCLRPNLHISLQHPLHCLLCSSTLHHTCTCHSDIHQIGTHMCLPVLPQDADMSFSLQSLFCHLQNPSSMHALRCGILISQLCLHWKCLVLAHVCCQGAATPADLDAEHLCSGGASDFRRVSIMKVCLPVVSIMTVCLPVCRPWMHPAFVPTSVPATVPPCASCRFFHKASF